jgi:hypothetical protein
MVVVWQQTHAWLENAYVSFEVFVLRHAVEHVRDGGEAAVRMFCRHMRPTRQGVRRLTREAGTLRHLEVVQEEERIKVAE